MGFLFYMFVAAVAFGGGAYCGMIYTAKRARASNESAGSAATSSDGDDQGTANASVRSAATSSAGDDHGTANASVRSAATSSAGDDHGTASVRSAATSSAGDDQGTANESAGSAATSSDGDNQGTANASAGSAAPAPARLQPRSAPINSFKDVRPVLREMLGFLDGEQLFFTAVALLTLYLLFGTYNFICSYIIVVSFPVYQSVMTIRSQSKTDDTQWLAYWCAFALFSLLDHFIAPFGLYLLLKTAVLVYMLLPQTYGAHNCFVNYVQPMIDRMAERRTKNQTKGRWASAGGGGSKKDKKHKASKSSSGEQ